MVRIGFALVCALAVVWEPAPARALSCSAPPVLRLVYPRHNVLAPRNAVVFLTQTAHRRKINPRWLVLRDGVNKQAIATLSLPGRPRDGAASLAC